jgi:hypothetical protein
MRINGQAIDGFDWDAHNRDKILAKHGVTQEQVEHLFALGDDRYWQDDAHSAHEDRYVALGRDPDGRPLLVSFTLRWSRDRVLVRPISARRMHAKERRFYEEDPS